MTQEEALTYTILYLFESCLAHHPGFFCSSRRVLSAAFSSPLPYPLCSFLCLHLPPLTLQLTFFVTDRTLVASSPVTPTSTTTSHPGPLKDGDLFQIGLEPCGVLTCQDEMSTSSVCTAVKKKTKHKTENTVNNSERELVLVLQHQVQAHG